MSNFKVGDKVVCVDDDFTWPPDLEFWAWPFGAPKKDTIYLVSGIIESRFVSGIHARLLIAGLSQTWRGQEYGFSMRRFRKLITATERAEMEQEARV